MKKVKVYLCKTDYDYHIPDDINGINIYFSEKDLRKNRKCVETCGIVSCTLEFDNIIQEDKFFNKTKGR